MLEAILYRSLKLYSWLLRQASRRPARAPSESPVALMTGTFHSSNWIVAHLRPMLDSGRFARVVMVSTSEVEFPEQIEVVRPARWLRRMAGDVGSRTLTFAYQALRTRPEVLGGFHLLFNGLVTILLARMIRARSIYFCVGGPAEVQDGGLLSENKLFGRLPEASRRIEDELVRAVGFADAVVCMGSKAAAFMQQRSGAPVVVVNPGCVAPIALPQDAKRFDLIFLGRLAPIKNLAALLEALALLKRDGREVSLAVVGDGELRGALTEQAEALGVDDLVTFAGMQTNTQEWLLSAKIFVLSSLSEGLSLSLMEALTAGLPAIVPNVGDLGDLVKDGYNGRLLRESTPEALAAAIRELLEHESFDTLSRAAAQSAQYVSPARAAARWAHTMQHLGWSKCAV